MLVFYYYLTELMASNGQNREIEKYVIQGGEMLLLQVLESLFKRRWENKRSWAPLKTLKETKRRIHFTKSLFQMQHAEMWVSFWTYFIFCR